MLRLNMASPPALRNEVRPAYLERVIARRYRGSYFIGAFEDDIEKLWSNVRYRAMEFTESPKEIARQVVDIVGREHMNCGDEEDEVIIESNKKEEESKEKTFQLSFGTSWSYTVGGGVKVGGQFFNVANASLSLDGSRTKEKLEERKYEQVVNESVSQNYGILGTLKVAPKTKLKATITTWAVTYQSKTTTEVSCPSTIWIPARIQNRILNEILCGCACCRRTVYISARDLFQDEPGFREENEYVFFTRETSMSYLGETIEVKKEESPIVDAFSR